MNPTDVLTVAEVAREIRCTTRTVTNLCARGELRGFRIGRDWRVTRAALDAFKRGETLEAAS